MFELTKEELSRCSTEDYKCINDEIRRMLADSLPEKPDAHILDNFSLDDLDNVSVKQYRREWEVL